MNINCLLERLTLPVFMWKGANPHILAGPQQGAELSDD